MLREFGPWTSWKNRLRFRAREILSGLWELGQVFYMVGFVLKNSTTLMLYVFALEHVCRLFVFESRCARFWEQRLKMKCGGLGLVLAHYWHPLYTEYTPLAQFLYILYFCIYLSFLIFILYFPNIKISKKYFHKFSHLFLLFYCFFRHKNNLIVYTFIYWKLENNK